MKAQPESRNSQPLPAEKYRTTEKTCYEGRTSWGPRSSNTGPLGFKDSLEDGMRKMAPMPFEMAYTEINNMAPTPEERGVPIDQARMGAGANKLVHERKFG